VYRLKFSRYLACLAILLPFNLPTLALAAAAPTEVISNIRYIKKGGVRAIRVHFAFPVHYVSHSPLRRSDTLTINLHFNKKEVSDLSQLPLLQSMTPPISRYIPITEVTYLSENNAPKLVMKFSREVKYSVSQIMGVTSLLVFLPDTFKGKSTSRSKVKLPPIIKGKVSKSRADKMYRRGRRALQQGDNRSAIQIFSSLLSIPKHVYTQESLELLGLARERNGQKAHAKSAYSEYVEKYKNKDDKNSIRVKQRLADLVSARQKPKKRLKNRLKKKNRKQEYRSDFFASFSQFLDYSGSKSLVNGDKTTFQKDALSLSNLFLVGWRIRNGNYDIRNSFSANYRYNTISKKSKGFEIGSMFSKIKNSASGVYFTMGRQSSQSAGVLSKYDGFLFGYDLAEKIRINLVTGFPVLTTEKTKIQTDKLFTSVSLEFNNLFGTLDVSPYIYNQEIDNIVNRAAIGAEVRFFHDKLDFFGLYDRDTFFDTSNILLLRGKYIIQKQTSIRLNYDKRRSPSLEMENILRQLDIDRIDTVGDIFTLVGGGANYSEDDLRKIALDKTGESRLLTVGVSHSFSDVLHVTVERSSSATVTPSVTKITRIDGNGDILVDESVLATLNEAPIRTLRKSNDFSIRFVTSQSFYRRDSAIVSFRSGRASNSSSSRLSLEYRWPATSKLRMNVRLKIQSREDYKDDPNGIKDRIVTTTKRVTPSIKFDYRSSKVIRIFGELSYKEDEGIKEENRVGQIEITEESQTNNLFASIGYSWEF